MTDGNDYAIPTTDRNIGEYGEPIEKIYLGLTKREYFAAMAMQGLCASGFFTDKRMQSQAESVGSNISVALATSALDIAEELINVLNVTDEKKA